MKNRYYYLQNVKAAEILNPIIVSVAFLSTVWIIIGTVRYQFIISDQVNSILRPLYFMIYSIEVISLQNFPLPYFCNPFLRIRLTVLASPKRKLRLEVRIGF